MRKFRTSGSAGALGEQSPEATRPRMLPLPQKALDVTPEVLVYRPEALRVRGELRLAKRQAELAEADFRDSIKLAKSMGAKAYELRTAMSWARLLASQGRGEEAHVMLAEIYNWFTEGFDTPDLKEAKALLGVANRDRQGFGARSSRILAQIN